MNILIYLVYNQFLGLSVIIWSEILIALLFIFAALVPILNQKRILKISVKGHRALAITALTLLLIHISISLIISL